MDKLHRGLVEKTNDFINCMIEAKALWEEIVEEGMSATRVTAEQCPQEFQTLFAMFGKSEFDTALPRMINHVRGYGGFEIFLSEIKDEEEED